MSDDWYKQLVAEEWIEGGKNKKSHFDAKGRRNEALDTWDYSYAIAHLYGAGIASMTNREWSALESRLGVTAQPLVPQRAAQGESQAAPAVHASQHVRRPSPRIIGRFF